MKTKAILAVVIAGAMGFSSCTNSVDQNTTAAITQFSTDWTSLGEKSTNWNNQLTETSTQAKEFATQQSNIVASIDKIKDEATRTQIQQMAQSANDDATRFDQMTQEYNTFKATYDQTTAEFTAWNEKVTKGEIAPEEVASGLASFQTKLTEAQTQFDNWNTTFNDVKTSIERNRTAYSEISASVEKFIK
jgi:chromosome segregation ATPase